MLGAGWFPAGGVSFGCFVPTASWAGAFGVGELSALGVCSGGELFCGTLFSVGCGGCREFPPPTDCDTWGGISGEGLLIAVCWVKAATEVEVGVELAATEDIDVGNAFWVDVGETVTTAEVEEVDNGTGVAGGLDAAGFGRLVDEVEEGRGGLVFREDSISSSATTILGDAIVDGAPIRVRGTAIVEDCGLSSSSANDCEEPHTMEIL